jgi:hypothetical protein
VEKSREVIHCLQNASDWKFRHFRIITYGVATEGVMRPVVGVFCWGSCCPLHSEAFSEEFSLIYCLAEERERFEIAASFPC